MSYVLAVIGSREVYSESWVHRHIESYINQHGMPCSVVTGGARGVDTFAERWAKSKGIACEVIKPDYRTYKGHVAPLVRNRQIISAADRVLAIPHASKKSSGTRHAVDLAIKAHKPVTVRHAT